MDPETEWIKSEGESEICYHFYAESKNMIQINLFTKHKKKKIMSIESVMSSNDRGQDGWMGSSI